MVLMAPDPVGATIPSYIKDLVSLLIKLKLLNYLEVHSHKNETTHLLTSPIHFSSSCSSLIHYGKGGIWIGRERQFWSSLAFPFL